MLFGTSLQQTHTKTSHYSLAQRIMCKGVLQSQPKLSSIYTMHLRKWLYAPSSTSSFPSHAIPASHLIFLTLMWLWEGMASLLLPTIWLCPRREQVISCNENLMAVHFCKKTPNQHYLEQAEHFTSSRLNTTVNHLCKTVSCVLLLAYLKDMQRVCGSRGAQNWESCSQSSVRVVSAAILCRQVLRA